MQTVRLIRFQVNPQDGYYEMTFLNSLSGETGRRYRTLEEVQAEVTQLESTEDALIRFLLAYWINRSADLSNPASVLNKDVVIDFGHAQPIRVQ